MWQIQFGMDTPDNDDIRSLDVRYLGSDRDEDFDSDIIHSPVSSFRKPLAAGSTTGAEAVPDLTGDDGRNDGSARYSDAGSGRCTPPKITSSCGGLMDQPTQGAPIQGNVNLQVRNRSNASWKALVIFQFRLRGGTTLGQLLE